VIPCVAVDTPAFGGEHYEKDRAVRVLFHRHDCRERASGGETMIENDYVIEATAPQDSPFGSMALRKPQTTTKTPPTHRHAGMFGFRCMGGGQDPGARCKELTVEETACGIQTLFPAPSHKSSKDNSPRSHQKRTTKPPSPYRPGLKSHSRDANREGVGKQQRRMGVPPVRMWTHDAFRIPSRRGK